QRCREVRREGGGGYGHRGGIGATPPPAPHATGGNLSPQRSFGWRERRWAMKTLLFAIAGSAVVLTAAPAEARHYSNQVTCTKTRHDQCVAWRRMTRSEVRHHQLGFV